MSRGHATTKSMRCLAVGAAVLAGLVSLTSCSPIGCSGPDSPPAVELEANFWFGVHPAGELHACLDGRCTTMTSGRSVTEVQNPGPYPAGGRYTLAVVGTEAGRTVLDKKLEVEIVRATGASPDCPGGYAPPIVRIEVNGLTHVIANADDPPSVPLPSNGATPEYPLTPVPAPLPGRS